MSDDRAQGIIEAIELLERRCRDSMWLWQKETLRASIKALEEFLQQVEDLQNHGTD